MLARDRKKQPRAEGPRHPAASIANERSAIPGDADLLKMLHSMKLTRALENRIERKLYRQGKIVGGVYVGRGQEAISVGSCTLTRPQDVVCPSHRDMAAFLIRGMTPPRILAQYMGRRD